ncbi:MAG TPA: ArsR family transcriptional regulator [Microthrixaceae bacterium]|nr:ArsR family transcriptional regulator [Microthrixaceae bacterium]
MSTIQKQARALGDPTRHGIFMLIAEADHAVGVSELTGHFGLNHNAIRQHLAHLVAAGLVIERKGRSAGRGRPPHEYLIDPSAQNRWGVVGSYEQISRLLAEVITSGLAPEEVGRRSAQHLRAPDTSVDPIADLSIAMARQGFQPEVREVPGGADVVLHSCPFASTASVAREVVCSMHLGIAEGLIEGTDLRVEELVACDPDSANCVLRVRYDASTEPELRRGKLTLAGDTAPDEPG